MDTQEIKAKVTLVFDTKQSWSLELPIIDIVYLFEALHARQTYQYNRYIDDYRNPQFYIDGARVIMAYVDYPEDLEVEFE